MPSGYSVAISAEMRSGPLSSAQAPFFISNSLRFLYFDFHFLISFLADSKSFFASKKIV